MRRLFRLPRYRRDAARRKARWAGSGRGKSGGVRVIYYFAAPDAVYFIAVYARNEKENLSDCEKKALAKILRPLKQQEH